MVFYSRLVWNKIDIKDIYGINIYLFIDIWIVGKLELWIGY